MRPIPLVALLFAVATAPMTKADVYAPNTIPTLGGLNTIFRTGNSSARQYQEYIASTEFSFLPKPILITGIQVRLPDSPPFISDWPPSPVTFSSYIIYLGTATPDLVDFLALHNTFDVNVPFLGNMVNPLMVYNGPLVLATSAFQQSINSPVISFNVANYQLRPGDNLVVYISHSTSDQTFTAPGFETVDPTGTTTSSAVFIPNNTSAGWAGGSTANPYLINLVTAARLTNVSTRARVETGANIMIAGFVVGGTSPKRVLIRALGPSLSAQGVPNILTDPQLVIFQGPTPIAQNDNWQTGNSADDIQFMQKAGLAPGDPRESALVRTLTPGAYTAQVLGVGGTSGVALIEAYDLDAIAPSTLINLSTRAKVQTGNDIVIAGFAIRGNAKKVLVRGIGPSLTALHVPNPLQDPTLQLIDQATGQIIAENDNWQSGSASNTAAIQRTGFAPSDQRESALLMLALPEGNYTALLRGVNSTIGVGLVEVYEVQ